MVKHFRHIVVMYSFLANFLSYCKGFQKIPLGGDWEVALRREGFSEKYFAKPTSFKGF